MRITLNHKALVGARSNDYLRGSVNKGRRDIPEDQRIVILISLIGRK